MMERCPVDSQPIVALDPAWPAMSIAEAEALLTAPGQKFEMETVTIRGVPTRVWKHSPVHLRALIEAGRAYGGLPFTIYEEEGVCYDANFRHYVALEAKPSAIGVGTGVSMDLDMRDLNNLLGRGLAMWTLVRRGV